MAHSSSSSSDESITGINVTPLVDIMLVLLIIFMIAAPVIQSAIEIEVPRTQVVRQLSELRIVVSIDREQTIFLQNEPVNINELGPRIAALMPDSAEIGGTGFPGGRPAMRLPEIRRFSSRTRPGAAPLDARPFGVRRTGILLREA